MDEITNRRLRVLALSLADVLCISAVWTVVVFGYKAFGLATYQVGEYLRFWPVALLFVAVNAIFRLYHGNPFYPSMPIAPVEEFRRLVCSSLVIHLLVIAFLGLRHEVGLVSRVVVVFSAAGVAILAQPIRDVVRGLLFRSGVGKIRAVFVGRGAISEKLRRQLEESAHVGFCLYPYDGDNHGIVDFAKERDIKILVTCQDMRLVREEMVELVKWFEHIEYFPSHEVFPFAGARMVSVGATGGIEMVNQRRLSGLRHEKRIVDSALSLMIGFCALPFFLVVPILIKLTSKGPILYKAKRLGKCGREIRVWKFRSMYADADQRLAALLDSDPALKAEFQKDFKLKNDPRVTPLGRIIRKTSIDELPQLWNVIRGEMALVGPRPIVEKEISYYGDDYEIFSQVRPGITGLWQATGRSDTDYARRVALDKYYVLNWSPWMDLWIVLRTIFAVLKMKGSY